MTTTQFQLGLAIALALATLANALPTIQVTHHFGDPFLQANKLRSATIRIVGFEDGQSIQGFVGTFQRPWNVGAPGLEFFNIDSVVDPNDPKSFLFEDGFYAAPAGNPTLNELTGGAARWDSGLLGNPATLGSPADGDPADDVGGFAFLTDGTSDINIGNMAWISLQPNGVPVNASTQWPVMRLTWPIESSPNTVSFILSMNTPSQAIPMGVLLFVLDAFGACCFESDVCSMVSWTWCESNGGTFLGNFTECGFVACPQCFADLTGDAQVDVHDLLAVIAAWGENFLNPADLNSDGTVNVLDLLALINAWGACP